MNAPARRCRDEPGLDRCAVGGGDMTHPTHSTEIQSERRVFIAHTRGIDRLRNGIEALLGGQVVARDHETNRNPIAVASTTVNSKEDLRPPPPNSLLTPTQAARRLNCSIKTLNGHIASGALRYVNVGHGRVRVRRMFTDADLDEFIQVQTRKVTPCPSTAGR